LVKKTQKTDKTLSDVFSGLMSESDPSIQMEIVDQLLSTDNLEQKTELEKPIKWSILTIVQTYLENKKMQKSANIIKNFVSISMRYLISKNRQSRKEYIEALNSLNDTNSGNTTNDTN
jgi:hypothetical protein